MIEYPHADFRTGRRASLSRILKAVAENETESQTLDFKQNRDRAGVTSKLLDSNRENLGKLISAFANTSGGLIVWGVESKDGRANVADPIPEIANFVQQLNTFTGGITDPPVTGVESLGVIASRGSTAGYAVTFVPESTRKPHQCIANTRSRNYWMRVGSNVETMPHPFIRAQMLERQRPQLRIVGCEPQVYAHRSGSLFSMQRIGLFNCGEAIAKHAALAVDARPGAVQLFGQPLTTEQAEAVIWDRYESMDSRRPCKLFRLDPGTVIYPGMEVDMLTVRFLFDSLDAFRFLQLNFLIYCDGFSGISQLMWKPSDIDFAVKRHYEDYPTTLESMI